MALTQPYTYNQVVTLLSDIATNHYQIHSFVDGDLWEVMESNQAAHKKFPLLWVRPLSANLEFPFETVRMGIAVMDLVNTDESNENEVLSDTLTILSDIKSILDTPSYANTFIVSKSASLTPFTERFSAKVTGWAMELDVKIQWLGDRCAIPISSAPTVNNLCKPVTIYDAEGNIIATVPSGGTYQVGEDAHVNVNGVLFATVISGDTLNVPVKNSSGTNVGTIGSGIVTVPDATAVLKDSASNTILSEAIPSGVSENITAPDGTINLVNTDGDAVSTQTVRSNQTKSVTLANVAWTDSDGSAESTPYTDAIVCTPQVKSLFSKFTWESGDDTTSTVTIDADSAGTYTSSTTDGASGTITYSKNGGAYAAFSNPTTYANGDTLAVKRTVTTALGWVKITGTYV